MLPSGHADEEILRTVVESPRDALVALPDMLVIERAGWKQIITPSFARGGFNEVAHAALREADADRVIAETIARYRSEGIAFRWVVGPDSAPADLAARLAGAGLRATSSIGLARATLPLRSRGEPLVEVRAVDAATLDVFTWVSAAGWRMELRPLGVAHAAMLADPARRHRLFLATLEGEPAGAASYVVFPRSVHLLNAVVLEPYRRRGVYRALVQARLDDARAQGLHLATTQAMVETSGPVLRQLGFVEICTFTTFHG